MPTDTSPATPGRHQALDAVSLAERPDLREDHKRIGGSGWPKFMLHDPVVGRCLGKVLDHQGAFQLTLLDGDDAVGVVNTAPLRFEGAVQDLPDRGVDWGLETSVQDHEGGRRPNALMGVQVVIDGAHRGKGLSRLAVAEMIGLAARNGMERIILPVRPNCKHRFPLIAMEQYIAWRNEDGLPFDDWLRVHVRLGGEIVRVCAESMIIPGTVEEWARWTDLSFPGSGRYVVPGALNPVEIDLDRDVGVYREANVWLVHKVVP